MKATILIICVVLLVGAIALAEYVKRKFRPGHKWLTRIEVIGNYDDEMEDFWEAETQVKKHICEAYNYKALKEKTDEE